MHWSPRHKGPQGSNGHAGDANDPHLLLMHRWRNAEDRLRLQAGLPNLQDEWFKCEAADDGMAASIERGSDSGQR